MATRPIVKNLNATSVGVLNWVLADQSGYLAGAPAVEDTVESIRQIGEFINAYQPRQNQFLSSLVNRIGLVIISSKAYSNPWNWVKRGTLDYGEAIEDIYVNLAKVEDFKPDQTTNNTLADLFGTRKPDVMAAFHQMNFQKKYPVTVSEDQLRTAFTSMEGVNNLIDYIVQSLYTAFEYDEFIIYEYMLGRLALEGKIKAIKIDTVSAANAKGIVSKIKEVSNNMTFMKTDYNMANVFTHTPKEEQYVLKSTDADAIIDVEVLAMAFHMDKAEFAGHQVLMDDYDAAKADRLNLLLGDDPSFKAFTDDELTLLNTIKFYVLDKDFLMQYEKLVKMVEQPIPNELKWQYFLHHWALFSASPFKNATLFTTQASAISGVTVTPSTANLYPGQSLQLTATVASVGFINQDVVWSVTGATDTDTKITRNGILTLGDDEVAATEITVKATSVADSTVYGTATITVAGETSGD